MSAFRLFQMMGFPTPCPRQESSDQFPMAFGNALLRAKKTQWSRKTGEPAHEQLAGLLHQLSVGFSPILEFDEDIPEFDQRAIGNTSAGERLLNSRVGPFGFYPDSHARPVWSQPDIDHGFDAMVAQELDELLA